MKTLDILKELSETHTGIYKEGEIYGCTELSLVWQHEFRHFEQFTKGISSKLHEISYVIFYTLGIFLLFMSLTFKDISLYTIIPNIGLIALPHLAVMLYFEAEAWIIAFIRRFKGYDPRKKYNSNEIPNTNASKSLTSSGAIYSTIFIILILAFIIYSMTL